VIKVVPKSRLKETLAGLKPVTSQHVFSVGPPTPNIKDSSLLVTSQMEQTKLWFYDKKEKDPDALYQPWGPVKCEGQGKKGSVFPVFLPFLPPLLSEGNERRKRTTGVSEPRQN